MSTLDDLHQALLQAMEQRISAEAAWCSISEKTRRDFQECRCALQLQARHQGRQLQSDDVPHDLRHAFNAHQECARARTDVDEARQAREKARRAAEPIKTVRQIREVLHDLQKVVQDSPGDARALALALHRARDVGVSPGQLGRYEATINQWYDEQPFAVCISTLSDQQYMDVSGAWLCADFKEKVANKFGWDPASTKLFLDGVHLNDASKRVHECGLSPEKNTIAAVQVKDEVEDSHNRSVGQLLRLQTDFLALNLPVDPSDMKSGAVHEEGRRWMLELVKEAVARGLQDIPEAARILLQVEDGEISCDDARRRVRANARSASDVPEPLADVDKQFLKSDERRLADISAKTKRYEPIRQRREQTQKYSASIGRDARSWMPSTDGAGHARAVLCVKYPRLD